MRYYILFFFTLLTTAISNLSAQLDFSADKNEGCGSLTVSFTASYPGTINKTLWDFGNGRTSLELSPVIIYSQAGSYNVKLTVNDSSSALVKLNFIKVRPNPDARFLIVDSASNGPYLYTFTAAPQPADTFIYTYNWLFSDNTSDTGPVVIHKFDSSGTYTAWLKVTDDFGCIDSFQHLIRATSKIIVPNVFTPNNDNRNDVLEIQTNGKSKYLFRVFSTTGILVFKLESVFISWGGENLSGERLNPGVYYYTLESLDTGNPLSQSGFIYLIR